MRKWIGNSEGKCVICSCRLDVLRALAKRLKEDNIEYVSFIGGQRDREEHLESFNRDPAVKCLLLSKGCGSAGLNLTAATRMVIMEPSWNPSQDAQAQARVWRLGQTKPCFITRLLRAGCLEEKILQRQVYKRGLWKQALETADLEEQQLRDIWLLDPQAKCTTWDPG